MKTVKEVIEELEKQAKEIVEKYPRIISVWLESKDHEIKDLNDYASERGKVIYWSEANCTPYLQIPFYESQIPVTIWIYGKKSVRTFYITEI